MSALTTVLLAFSLLGALDRILGCPLGIGREFDRAFMLIGTMALSMIGMIILAPALGIWLKPMFALFYDVFRIDPSVIPASLFANDMGGASLALEVTENAGVGAFNAYVVSSMMGCVISFTIPFAGGIVDSSQHKELFLGFLYGIVTIPIGCVAAGFLCGLTPLEIVLDLLPLILISGVIAVGLILTPDRCIKIFRLFGKLMTVLITVGLALGIFTFLSGKTVFVGLDTIENGMSICLSAAVTLSGAFPLMHVVGRLLGKPMSAVGSKIGINGTSALALIPTLVTNATAFGMMKDMDRKGVVLNSAFAVSAAFVFGSHLGFTMAFDERYVAPMIVAKLVSGVSALLLALLLYREKPAQSA